MAARGQGRGPVHTPQWCQVVAGPVRVGLWRRACQQTEAHTGSSSTQRSGPRRAGWLRQGEGHRQAGRRAPGSTPRAVSPRFHSMRRPWHLGGEVGLLAKQMLYACTGRREPEDITGTLCWCWWVWAGAGERSERRGTILRVTWVGNTVDPWHGRMPGCHLARSGPFRRCTTRCGISH